MSNQKELHIASKEILLQYGARIIATPQYKNLLADYGAFKDIPAAKQIITDLLKAGFGEFLYDLYQQKDKDILEKCYNHRIEFLSEGKYREDVTVYVYASMLYSLGLIDDISEPKVKNPFSADKSSQENIREKKKVQHTDLGRLVEQLKHEYLQLLKCVIVPDPNGEGQASGYYSTSTRTKLLVIEEKLRIIGERNNKDYGTWCKAEKDKALGKYFKDENGQRRALVEALKKKYLDTFALYHKPSGKRVNGYFDEETLTLQKELEPDISHLCTCLGEDKDWCSNEKEKFLDERRTAEKKRKNIFTVIVATICAVLISAVIVAFNYINSTEDRASFEETYALALSANNSGDYIKAIDLFTQAEKNYNASWKSSDYKSRAHEGAIAASSKVFDSEYSTIKKSLDEFDYVGGYIAIKSLPSNLILDTSRQEQLENANALIDSNLESSLKSELDGLINQIYSSKGKLSESALNRLTDLLKVDENNYWFNFIKNKVK